MVARWAVVVVLFVACASSFADETGPALSQKYGCVACHAENTRVMAVWPSFKEIADKYRGDKTAKDKLIHKLKTGGKGVWGTVAEQPAYAEEITDQNHYNILIVWVLSH